MNIEKRVAALVKRHGSYRKAAKAIGVGYSYLCRLRTGSRTNPSTVMLRKLGLMK